VSSCHTVPRRCSRPLTGCLALLLLLAAPACRREGPYPSKNGAEVTDSAGIQDGGTLVRRLEDDVGSLNFVLMKTDYEKQVLSYLHDPLLDLDADMRLVPALARSWEVAPDGKTYTFHLDPRANFSDGSKVLASDVVFTLRAIVNPATQSAQYAALFEGLDIAKTVALDPLTVQVVFNTARASQLSAFNIPVLPEHVYGKGDFRRDFNEKVVGSGPYVLARRQRGSQILLERRENYWRTRPYIRRILFKIISDEAVAWNAMKRGDIDEIRVSSDHWNFDRNDPQVQKVMDLRRFYGLDYNFIPWNNRDPLLSDKRVRKALSMCLDRSSLIKDLYYGTARIITGPFTPDQWAYNPAVPPVEFNIAGARQLLGQAGWRDTDGDGILDRGGKPLEIEFLVRGGNKTSEQLAQIYQATLKQAGVLLKITPTDQATYFERFTTGKYQGAIFAWDLDVDPDPFPYFHSSQIPPNGENYVYYSNPAADRLMEQARQELDFQKRVQLYQQLHAILAEDQPYTWIVQVSTKWAVNHRVRNMKEAKGLGLFLWYPGPLDWWIPADARSHEKLPTQLR
jgi:peptide/nickel transport system substrate-binding protein